MPRSLTGWCSVFKHWEKDDGIGIDALYLKLKRVTFAALKRFQFHQLPQYLKDGLDGGLIVRACGMDALCFVLY
jgi:hypothetical protein